MLVLQGCQNFCKNTREKRERETFKPKEPQCEFLKTGALIWIDMTSYTVSLEFLRKDRLREWCRFERHLRWYFTLESSNKRHLSVILFHNVIAQINLKIRMLNMKLLILGSVRVENRTVQCTRCIDDHHPRDFSISVFTRLFFLSLWIVFPPLFLFFSLGFGAVIFARDTSEMSQYE